jgi:hypothetical protein
MNIRDDIDMGDITSAQKMIVSYIDTILFIPHIINWLFMQLNIIRKSNTQY